jgi:uncharacterized protein
MELLTWAGFGEAGRALARSVADDGYRPDVVLAVARGGVLLAGSLSYALDVKTMHLVNVEFYTGVNARLESPVLLPPTPQPADLTDARVLIVDDVADTGATLKLVRDLYADHVADARLAVLYEKPESVITCDYVWSRTDQWINFPWSSEPPVVSR